MYRTIARGALLCLSLTGISACIGPGYGGHFFSDGDQYQESDGRFIDTVHSDLNLDGSLPANTSVHEKWEEGFRYLRYGNNTAARLPELNAYANQVLARLHRGISSGEIYVTTSITPHRDFRAYTLEQGIIVISLGALRTLENEDELAALLAHEYAHQLLYHHAKNNLQQVTDYGMRYASIYLGTQSGSTSNLHEKAAALLVSRWVTDNALFPNWNRGQESDADVLGVDLMLRANYNADAMLSMLKKLEMSAGERKAFIAQNPTSIKKSKNKTTFTLDVGKLLGNVIGTLEDKFDRDYETARERQQLVRDYLKLQYRSRPRMAMRKSQYTNHFRQSETRERVEQYVSAHRAQQGLLQGKKGLTSAEKYGHKALGGALGEDPYTRMTMFDVRAFQGEDDKALYNLMAAYNTGEAGMHTYEILTALYMQAEQWGRAEEMLSEMEVLFDKPDEILPASILVKKELGESTSASMYLLRCLATGDIKLIDRCDQT